MPLFQFTYDVTFFTLICLIIAAIKHTLDNWEEDAEIVKQIRAGNRNAFAGLVEKYQKDIYTVCYCRLWNKDEAEDAAMESFTRSFQQIGKLKNENQYYGWLKMIALNHCNDVLNHRMREGSELPENESQDMNPINVSNPVQADTLVEKKQVIIAVREALEELSDSDREIIMLKHFQDLKFSEVSERLGITESAAKLRFYRALEKLSGKLNAFRE